MMLVEPTQRAREIGARVERFVRDVVIPFESDARRDHMIARLMIWSGICGRRLARLAC